MNKVDDRTAYEKLLIEYAKLETENAELKSEKGCETCTKFDEVKLTKAKEIIRQFLNDYPVITKELLDKLEQFISEVEK